MLIKIALSIVLGVMITLIVAVGLVVTDPAKPVAEAKVLDFDEYLSSDTGMPVIPPLLSTAMRDGYGLKYRRFDGPEGAPLLVLLHGSGWHGLQFIGMAQKLSEKATVLAPDLRGHGTAPGRRGDINYIAQLEDDMVDLITAVHVPGQKIVMGGHSSGGGLVVRFAGSEYGTLLDGAVLLAPFLKHNAPTTQENSGGWEKVQVRRIIGLSILNAFRITALNDKSVIQFVMPKQVLDGPLGDTATTAYSYRMNRGFAPRGDYLADVAALPAFLLVAGADDSAFYADKYEETMAPVNDKGTYLIVPGYGHLAIVDAPETAQAILDFLDAI
jgi:alpha-beta hydrolase superfamily lysophospholipase